MKEDHSASFKAFFDDWASTRIRDLGPSTDPSDWRYITNERSKEIIKLASEHAYRAALEEHARPYGSVRDLIEHLFERKKARSDPW